MEQEFYRDEFEQLLKDTTEDFKMYPSRKVWHSIYNDLHPDRKWPSLAVCLLLLTTILYVGVTNNNAINNDSKKNAPSISVNSRQPDVEQGEDAKPSGNRMAALDLAALNTASANFPILLTTGSEQYFPLEVVPTQPAAGSPVEVEETVTAVQYQPISTPKALPGDKAANQQSLPGNAVASVSATAPVAEAAAIAEEVVADPVADPAINSETDLAKLAAANKAYLLAHRDTRQQEFIEDFAFHNKPQQHSIKKLFRGVATQFYITPSVGYRVRFRNENYREVDNSLVTNNNSRITDKTELNQQAAINMEAGAGIVKDLGKRFRFKTGLQFNFTDHITYAQRLDHPTQATIAMSNQVPGLNQSTYQADYAHTPGNNNSKLHNSTIQLSIPLGMDYKLLTKGAINWYVGTTIQPTFVTRTNAYLLSADANYFVKDDGMIRRLNLNGALESFVSIKTKSGTFINLGPQFRYQLFSTYSKAYTYTEKPYSVGLKVGFVRPL
ncbi:MAG: hypothetical protein EOO06_03035 [Chitinophagaceae bacterium]|nr:MAG: hypothetical protein EOO06_03035 [Chitinophagaceae bacterium]